MSRVPDFFIAGHPKSGTSALYELLRGHPRIYMADVEKPGWFASDIAGHETQVETFPAYLALFDGAGPEQLAGEATPEYIWSRTAAAEIARVQPAARVIVIVREPAAYLRALHLDLLGAGMESEPDLLVAIQLEQDRMSRSALLHYSRHVRYVEQLRRFHACFDNEQLLVIVYDDFRADPTGTVNGVLQFLGVRDGALQSQQPQMGAIEASPATARLRARVRSGVRRHLLPGAPRRSDEELLLELRHRFKPEVEALSDHLQRDLVALWGYEGIA